MRTRFGGDPTVVGRVSPIPGLDFEIIFRLLRDHGFQYTRSTERVKVRGEVADVSIYHGGRKLASHDYRR